MKIGGGDQNVHIAYRGGCQIVHVCLQEGEGGQKSQKNDYIVCVRPQSQEYV